MTERFVELTDGGRIRVLEAGAGKPVVFVHGWPTNANAWRGQLEALSGSHRVLALDLRGFGESSSIPSPTIEKLAADVHEVLEREGIEDAIPIGWSMGGCVVLEYCRRFGSDRLRGIGIVDVSPKLWPADDWPLGEGTPFSREAIEEWSRRWYEDRRSLAWEVYTIGLKDVEKHAADREWLVEESMKADPDTAMTCLLDAFDADYRDVLPTVDVPAILLYGAASTSTTRYTREFMERALPDAELVVFDESSHCLMLEEPEKFNRSVDAFARRA